MPNGAEQCPQRLQRPLVSPTTRVPQRPPAGSGPGRRSPKADSECSTRRTLRTASTYSADVPVTSETASAVSLPGRSALERSRDRTHAAASVRAVPGVVRHIDIGAGEDESGYDVGVPPGCGKDERRLPADESAAGTDIAQPLQSDILAHTHRCP